MSWYQLASVHTHLWHLLQFVESEGSCTLICNINTVTRPKIEHIITSQWCSKAVTEKNLINNLSLWRCLYIPYKHLHIWTIFYSVFDFGPASQKQLKSWFIRLTDIRTHWRLTLQLYCWKCSYQSGGAYLETDGYMESDRTTSTASFCWGWKPGVEGDCFCLARPWESPPAKTHWLLKHGRQGLVVSRVPEGTLTYQTFCLW